MSTPGGTLIMPHGYFKMVCVSDLHFGNPRINAAEMYEELVTHLYPQIKDAHLVTINGDIYDQLLTISSQAYRYAAYFIKDLFTYSAKSGVQIRILHGTYSHDRDQLSIFSTLALPKTRYKIVNHIEAEEISDFRNGDEYLNMKLRVGYLPDNLSYTKSYEAVEHLKRTMQVLGFTSLDLLIGHGTFIHTLPTGDTHMPPCTYTLEQFDDIVKGPIVMGHIHTSSRKYNCYYCGSFERMAHGEEETKGFYTFTRDVPNKEGWRAKFCPNPEATPFLSIEPVGEDIPALTRNYVEQVKAKLPNGRGYVRVIHPEAEVRAIIHKVSNQQFPNLIFSSKSTGKVSDHELKVTDIDLEISADVKPTKNNLGELICQFLEERNQLQDVTREEILAKTQEVLNEIT